MKANEKIAWKRLFVEAAAIVGSILLAFAIDAWWDDRQRDESEQVVLQTLLDDLRVKQVLLADMNDFCEAIIGSAETLLRAASNTEQKLSEDSIDRLISDTWWVNNDALWDSAPLSQLVVGGNLSLIANADMVQITASMKHRPGQPETTIKMRDLGSSKGYRHSELLSTIEFKNLLIAKMERISDILEVGHPGVEGRLAQVIEMLESELDN